MTASLILDSDSAHPPTVVCAALEVFFGVGVLVYFYCVFHCALDAIILRN